MARFAFAYLLCLSFNVAFWNPIHVHRPLRRLPINCFSSPLIVFSIPINGNDPRRFGVLYFMWKLCGHNSTVPPYQWRWNQVTLIVSDLKFPHFFFLSFFKLISSHILEMVDVESSIPGLFSASASPSKKKAGSAGTTKVKIQLKHTDTSCRILSSLESICSK